MSDYYYTTVSTMSTIYSDYYNTAWSYRSVFDDYQSSSDEAEKEPKEEFDDGSIIPLENF